jgi:hypothetical protein
MANEKSYTDVLDRKAWGCERSDMEQVTVWEPDENNGVHVWFENDDGECAFVFTPDERRRLIAHLQNGLD